jgi:6-phosphogluconolactonase
MARETLLDPLGILADDPRVHRIPTEGVTVQGDAALYEQNLRYFFGLQPGELPRFDLVLLGMGEDGHTASLFPDTPALEEQERLVVSNEGPEPGSTRITVTFPVLNAARAILVLVRGPVKAALVAKILEGTEVHYPIQRVQPTDGEMVWMVG